MEIERSATDPAVLRAENVGVIRQTTVELSPGVTLLVGRNATNRTSFLQAVMAALGSDNVSIRGDAEEAEVELTLGDKTHTQLVRRDANGVSLAKEAYLDDPDFAELFAFLLESNEARRAVALDADLREIIMRPVDTEEIQAEIEELVDTRESLRTELDEIEDLKRTLPELEEQRDDLESRIASKKSDLEATEAELASASAEVDEPPEEGSILEEKLEELRAKRSELDDIRYEIETEQESLEAATQDRREIEAELAELPDVQTEEIEQLESEIRRLRDRKQEAETEVNEIQSVIEFNEQMLDDAGAAAFEELSDDETTGTDQLLNDDEATCWTCGSTVEREQIEATLARLREQSRTEVGEVNDLEARLDELSAEKREYEQARRERARLEDRRAEVESEQAAIEERVEALRERREAITDEIESVQADVEALEADGADVVLDLHEEANQLEYELGQLENDFERIDANIREIESRIADQSEIEDRLETVSGEIESLRTKIDRIEDEAVEQFNEHMEEIVALLDYANLERVWIERTQREVREGRQTVTKNTFDLHVIRKSASGTAYEDTVDHLSESEREVTGLVFALAGYLAHDVYERVPFVLLDSLEAIDSDRIAALVKYLDEYAGYLVVALLPEDAAALPEEYDRVTEI